MSPSRPESSGRLFAGTALSQTTPPPAAASTTPSVNVTMVTVTPVILSSTTPGCTAFNTSTCEPCAPGSQYDNSKPGGRLLRPLWGHHAGVYACVFSCRHPDVLVLLCPWAVSVPRSVPAMQQRVLSAPVWTTTVLALQPRLLRKVNTNTMLTHLQLHRLLFRPLFVLSASLGVLCAAPARPVPSTTTPERTVAKVAPQVRLWNGDNSKKHTFQAGWLTSCWDVSHGLLPGFHSSHQSSTSCAPCSLGTFCK